MRLKPSPRIGCVKYLNARPLIHGWPGVVTLDHPAAIARLLAGGELDLALVSAVELLRHPVYRVVRGLGIVSDGPVYSVIVAHEGRREELTSVALDSTSLTSTALLRVLSGKQLALVTRDEPLPRNGVGKMLIGDPAIRFRAQYRARFSYWDLAEEWRARTGLPFVFALWLVRPEFAVGAEIGKQLRLLRAANFARLDEIIAAIPEFPADFSRTYFTTFLRFDFKSDAQEGLSEFHRRGLAAGLDFAPRLQLDFV